MNGGVGESFLRFKDWVAQTVGIDDAVDRLNRKFTALTLLICVVPLFGKQYIGEPIQCFTPTYFTHSQADYVNNYCWTSSTFYIMDIEGEGATSTRQNGNILTQQGNHGHEAEYIGPNTKGRKQRVSYYQWTPILLALQAFLFHFPFMLWHSFAINSGVQVKTLINGARQVAKFHIKKQYKDALLLEFCEEFDRFMSITHNDSATGCLQRLKQNVCMGKLYGNYLFFLFLLIKFFYMVNLTFQLYCLTLFLGTEHILHGFNVIYGLIYEDTWISSLRFPIQTICEYSAHQQGNLLHYTVQCVLPINLYNDKLYACLTLWFIFLLLATFLSVFLWVWRNASRTRMSFVKGYLTRMKKLKNREDKRLSRKFASVYLRRDGVFLLQLVEINIGGIVVAAVLDKLWDDFKRIHMHELHGSTLASQASGTAWPPSPPLHINGVTPDHPLLGHQTAGQIYLKLNNPEKKSDLDGHAHLLGNDRAPHYGANSIRDVPPPPATAPTHRDAGSGTTHSTLRDNLRETLSQRINALNSGGGGGGGVLGGQNCNQLSGSNNESHHSSPRSVCNNPHAAQLQRGGTNYGGGGGGGGGSSSVHCSPVKRNRGKVGNLKPTAPAPPRDPF